MSGNKISVKTLNLDIEFDKIAAQLDKIAASYFEYEVKEKDKDRTEIV